MAPARQIQLSISFPPAYLDQMTSNLDRNIRVNAIVQLAKMVSEEGPVYPLYYNYDVRAHAAALQGPQPYGPEPPRLL